MKLLETKPNILGAYLRDCFFLRDLNFDQHSTWSFRPEVIDACDCYADDEDEYDDVIYTRASLVIDGIGRVEVSWCAEMETLAFGFPDEPNGYLLYTNEDKSDEAWERIE